MVLNSDFCISSYCDNVQIPAFTLKFLISLKNNLYMAKVLFVISSGDEKFDLAIRLAYNSYNKHLYDDVKVVLFGPSQKRVLTLEGDIKDIFLKLLENGVVDSACIGVAKSNDLVEQLTDLGLRLEPMGERISKFVNQGYEVITF
jgi:hypothetical protein